MLSLIQLEAGASHTSQFVFNDERNYMPKTGTYHVRVVYRNASSSFQGKALWVGTVESEPVTLIIE